MAETTILHENKDSIEISKNAKGDIAWKAKLYFDDETQEYADVVDKLAAIHNALMERFL